MNQYGIEMIRHDILFEFQDEVTNDGRFKHETNLIVVPKGDVSTDALSTCRYVNVLSVGPACTEVTEGMTVVVKNLQWTTGFKVNGRRVWKTNEDQIVAIVEQ